MTHCIENQKPIVSLCVSPIIIAKSLEGHAVSPHLTFGNVYKESDYDIKEFNPDLIGVSAMTFHKDFFHKAISEIRKEGYSKMIITGGPHPTTSYKEVLKDKKPTLEPSIQLND